MIRRAPIRTYERKNRDRPGYTFCQSTCGNVDEGGGRKLAIDSDNSLREDPFETTFDRIARNARMPPPVETGGDRSWLSSSYESDKGKSLSRVSVDPPDDLVGTVPRYLSRRMRVVEGRLTKSGRRLRNREKTLEKSTNVSFKIPPKTRRKRGRPLGRTGKKKQTEKTGSLSSSRGKRNCNIEISVRNEEDKTNGLPISADWLAGSESQTESQKLLGVKSCSIVLNKLPVEQFKQNGRVTLRGSRKEERHSQGLGENSVERSTGLRECSILVERLRLSPFAKSRIKKLISSTPIGKKSKRLSAQLIPLSPIPLSESKALNQPDGHSVEDSDDKCAICPVYKDGSTELLCASASYTFDKRNKADLSPGGKLSEICLDTTEKLETGYSKKFNLYGVSVNISLCTNSIVIDEKHAQENSTQWMSKDGSYECLDGVGENVEPVEPETKGELRLSTPKLQRRQSVKGTESFERCNNGVNTNLERRTGQSRPHNSANASRNDTRKTELDGAGEIVELAVMTDQRRTYLHFSIDSERSRSLFDNTSLTAKDTTERSNSQPLLDASDSAATTESTRSLKGFSDSELASVNVKLEERLKILACDGELKELNGYSLRRSVKRNSEVTNEDGCKVDRSLDGPDKNQAEPFVLLTRLQDRTRVTNRRKKYGKWDLGLTDVLEDSEEPGNSSEAVPKRPKSSDRSNEASVNDERSSVSALPERNLYLKPGKSWARSLSILNGIKVRSDLDQLSVGKGKKWRHSVVDILNMQKQGVIQSCVKAGDEGSPAGTHQPLQVGLNGNVYRCSSINRPSRRISIRVVPNKKSLRPVEDAPFLEAYGIEPERSLDIAFSPRKSSVYDIRRSELQSSGHTRLTAREVVLQRCGQDDCLPFQECFTDPYLDHCRKIGEGVYGEVFLHEIHNERSVIKIIPIEGAELVNGEPQKKFDEILSEIVIAKELHNLRYNRDHNTDSFVEVKRIRCLFGEYPSRLVELWRAYDEERTSDNDCPVTFGQDQLYIVLELGHGGQDLEAFVFNNAEEACAVFVQTALALAVAEKAVEFEHRDLHWGNVLISRTDDPYVRYTLDGEEIIVPSHGVKASIIDFTLSRISYQGCYIFNDLALDPALFTAQGEYQFEVYRLMRDKVENDWQKFEPYTNVLWLHYTLDKMLTAVRYRKKTGRAHRAGLARLAELKGQVLSYESSFEFASNSGIVAGTMMRTRRRRTRNGRDRLPEDPLRATVPVST